MKYFMYNKTKNLSKVLINKKNESTLKLEHYTVTIITQKYHNFIINHNTMSLSCIFFHNKRIWNTG